MMKIASPRLTVFLAASVVSLAAIYHLTRPEPVEMPEHPHLARIPEELGKLELPPMVEGFAPQPVFQCVIPMPYALDRIQPLGECPVRTMHFGWNHGRHIISLSPNETMTYDETAFILSQVPGDMKDIALRRNLLRKAELLTPYARGALTLQRFELPGLRGFRIEPEGLPLQSREGHRTSYYLFPTSGTAPAMRVEALERGEALDRGVHGIHLFVLGMSYPGLSGDAERRLQAADHMRSHDEAELGMFEGITLGCSSKRREALFVVARAALAQYRFEIAREAVRALYKLGGPDTTDADYLLLTIHETQDLFQKNKAEGKAPPPVQWQVPDFE